MRPARARPEVRRNLRRPIDSCGCFNEAGPRKAGSPFEFLVLTAARSGASMRPARARPEVPSRFSVGLAAPALASMRPARARPEVRRGG